jgi:hypothetical protein
MLVATSNFLLPNATIIPELISRFVSLLLISHLPPHERWGFSGSPV